VLSTKDGVGSKLIGGSEGSGITLTTGFSFLEGLKIKNKTIAAATGIKINTGFINWFLLY
jgi:hypothetical protein